MDIGFRPTQWVFMYLSFCRLPLWSPLTVILSAKWKKQDWDPIMARGSRPICYALRLLMILRLDQTPDQLQIIR